MEKLILKYRKKINGTIISLLVLALIAGPVGLGVFAQEEEEDTVTVTATVEAWLDINIVEEALELDPDLVEADGTTNVGVASTEIELGTSNPGWTMQIEGTNEGLEQDVGVDPFLIGSVTERTELIAGDVGYGASMIGVVGGTTVPDAYVDEGDHVGPILGDAANILTRDEANEMEVVGELFIRAAASDITPAGDYEDSVIITASTGT